MTGKKPLRSFPPKLQLRTTRVNPAFAHQFGVVAILNGAAFVDNQNAIGFLHGRQAMRDHKRRAVGHQTIKRPLHCTFALGIKRAGRFIEQ